MSELRKFLRAVASKEDDSYQQAAANVLVELDSDLGNIPQPVIQGLERSITPAMAAASQGQTWQAVADVHHCLRREKDFTPRKPPVDKVSVVMPYSYLFLAAPSTFVGGGFTRARQLRRSLRQPASHQPSTEEALEAQDLPGTSGHPRATWWTFSPSDQDPWSGTGEDYMRALALSPDRLDQAREDGYVAVLTVRHSSLDTHLYKPSSLNGYGPDSQFRPDLSQAEHGYTAPLPPYPRQPELIGTTRTWHMLDKQHDKIHVTIYHFSENTRSTTP